MDRKQMLGLYARLTGLKDVLASFPVGVTTESLPAEDLVVIISKLQQVTEEDLSDFRPPQECVFRGGSGAKYCYVDMVKAKLHQLISYLDYTYHTRENIIEIGSIYNSINDEELKSRCADLLSAPGNFDRVINQATQVLEDRIRKKFEGGSGLTGTQLVNKLISSNPEASPIKVSSNKDEQEGIGHICRGMMLAFRNPTHHQITDRYSREDALKLCAFVDNLLKAVDDAKTSANE